MCFNPPKIPPHKLLHDGPPQPDIAIKALNLIIRGALLTMLALLLVARVQATPAKLMAPEQAETGQLLIQTSPDAYVPALHLHSQVNLQVHGMIATVELTQQFRNDSDQWSEGVYVFPLPETAAVNYMEMRIGERRIVGEIKEKREAEKIYRKARAAGKKAALTRQERPNLFTQKVANLAPGEQVEVTLRYLQQVTYEAGQFNLRLPTTLTPRYIPGQPLASESRLVATAQGWALPTDQMPDADRITPFVHPPSTGPNSDDDPTASGQMVNQMELTVTLNAGLPLAAIDSPYHQIVVKKEQGVHRVELAQGRVPMDRDFALNWRPVVGSAPEAALFTEDGEEHQYLSLMLLPPPLQNAQEHLPRELVFIIDTSGSMGGVSIRQAKSSLLLALSRLQSQDRFNVIEFNSSHRSLFAQPVAALAVNVKQAIEFVQALDAGGGTEMAPALAQALAGEAPETHLKQVVFITDGSVGNEQALFSLIHRELGSARLFTVGIGSAPNSFFMRKAAQFGRGTFTFIGSQGEVAGKMSELFRKLESPVLGNIRVQWPTQAVEMWPRRTPDLYAGEPLLISARLDRLEGEVTVEGQLNGRPWRRHLQLSAEGRRNGVATLWAREKISALLDQKITGRDAGEVRAEVLKVALTHQLVSPYTSFVAVEQRVSRPAQEALQTQPVPNLLPQGQQAAAVMYPRTATPALLHWLLGSLCLSLVMGIGFIRHRPGRGRRHGA